MREYRLLRKTFLCVVLPTALVFSYLFSDLAFQSASRQLPSELYEPVSFPKAKYVEAASLNYRTLAADMVWIITLTSFGEARRNGVTRPDLIRDANILADLDPNFRRPYDWFPAVFLSRRAQATEDELRRLTDYMERGSDAFPTDASIPYIAALNYIGYSAKGTKERRTREGNRAIELLETALARPDAPADTALLISYFKRRNARLSGNSSPSNLREETDALAQALLTLEDPTARERISRRIENSGTESPVARAAAEMDKKLDDAQAESEQSFLPVDLWIATNLPTWKNNQR